jgi:hypothetical protein
MPSGGTGSTRTAWPRASRAALVVVGVTWAGVLLAIAPQRIYLTTDTVSNHVHVWFIARQLWHGHGIPLHMPVLASGDALTFPYASLPWLVGALLWPLGGDHIVTVLLVVGAVAVIATTYWAVPAVRRGWWAVAVLLNPALLTSVLLGQLPFLWAAALFLGAIGAWRRERCFVATVLLALSLIVHPAVMLPISIVIVGIGVVLLRDRARLAVAWLVAAVVSVPAVVLTLDSPVVDQTSRRFELLTLGLTVLTRIWVIAVPLVYEQLARLPGTWGRLWLPLGVSVVSLGLFVPMWRPFSLDTGWAGLAGHSPADELHSFVSTPSLHRGRTYRVLTGADSKYGIYQVVRHGGVLDSELFPESLHRASFGSRLSYAEFLSDRRVQSIVVAPSYRRTYHSNEPGLVAAMAASGKCTAGIRIVPVEQGDGWLLYDVEPC